MVVFQKSPSFSFFYIRLLTINNITHYKGKQLIFKDLGFTVGLGSGIVLTGANGSGKTTLLRSMAGFTNLTQGNILWNNQDIKEFYPDFSSDISYIGHKNFLKQKLSVLNNLSFYAQLCGTEILLPAAIRYFSLEDILEKPVSQLSSGLQKKVLLSKLLCCPSTIWFLDEPTVNLDKNSKELLFNLISIKIKESGIVIIATHDETFFPLGNRVCLEDFK